MLYYEFTAMNTHIVLAAQGDDERVAQGVEIAREYIAAREAQFTRFQETSELMQLNRAAGTWFNASPELFDVMQQAYELHQQTEGLFDPSILNALEHAGYDVSMDIVRTRGASQVSTSAVTRGDFRATAFLPSQRAIWLAPSTRLDLGGIAKGWIAEHAAQCLADYANACAVNAGGDLFAHGVPSEGAWEIALEDPQDAERTLAVLKVPHGAVATSSITKRRWKQGNVERHHLIDPRTGLPAATDWLSVTVIAPHATVAEVFAKALLIAGSREAHSIAAYRDDIEFIAVDQDSKLWGSPNAKDFIV
ncbi:MAG TPA: FAD:protein FMN transferase [Anaerolineae bacterium]|nr:FAD:protein FMN transferase [Anaerolineae bacterium]